MAFFREVGSFPAVHALGKIFLYAVVVLLGGAMAAPLAWHLIAVLPADWLHGLIGEVQRMPFHRYLSRSIQVAAILLLWPLMRTLQIRSFEELGLYRSHRALRDFGVGLGAGIPSALLLSLQGGHFGILSPVSWQQPGDFHLGGDFRRSSLSESSIHRSRR